jgi:signal peptidase II
LQSMQKSFGRAKTCMNFIGAKLNRRILYLLIALVFLCVDQFSKLWVKSALYFGERIILIPNILDITYVENTGGAFGIFGGLSTPYKTIIFTVFALGAIALIIYYIIKITLESTSIYCGLALILSGAMGNFIDRLRLGYVVDFISLHYKNYHWPVFNVADMTICIGLAVIGISYLFTSAKEKKDKEVLSDAS